MSITGALILFACLWFLCFLVILPIGTRSQDEAGAVEPGTSPSAPADAVVGRKARQATLIAAGLWLVLAGVILSGAVSIRDLDLYGRMAPAAPPVPR